MSGEKKKGILEQEKERCKFFPYFCKLLKEKDLYEFMKTEILAQDKDILVCFKPAGLAVQSGRASEPDMVSELKNYRMKQEKSSYLGVIHRLDQPVSGVLVFAKNEKAAAFLSKQITDGEMEKIYHAGVYVAESLSEEARELLDGNWHELKDYLLKEPGNTSRIATREERGAKKAVLRCRCIKKEHGFALFEIKLFTGRHHQIRVQLSHAGFPILGDARYGSRESREESLNRRIRNIQLCAVKLSFLHPASKEKVSYEIHGKMECEK